MQLQRASPSLSSRLSRTPNATLKPLSPQLLGRCPAVTARPTTGGAGPRDLCSAAAALPAAVAPLAAAAAISAAPFLAPPAAGAAAAKAAATAAVAALQLPPAGEWVLAKLIADVLIPVAITWVLVAALNHLAHKAESMPNPEGVSFADVAPGALRGPAVAALVTLLILRLGRNIIGDLGAFLQLYKPHFGWAHETIDPVLRSACTAITALDDALLRFYGAAGVLFAAWALIELKHVAMGVWLSSGLGQGGPQGGEGAAVGAGAGPGAGQKWGVAGSTMDGLAGMDPIAVRELQRTVLPLSTLASWAIAGCAVILSLCVVGVDVTPLMTVGGASTIVVGLASQQLLSNLTNGISIFLTRPFVSGENVTLQQGGLMVSGTVLRVTPMRTVLRDPDGVVVSLPNKTVTDMVLYNRSRVASRLPSQLGALLRQPLRLRLRLGGGQAISALRDLREKVAERFAAAEQAGVAERGSSNVALGRLTDTGVELLATSTLITSEFGLASSPVQELLLDIYGIAGDHGASCATLGA